jgi:hypothetical protein
VPRGQAPSSRPSAHLPRSGEAARTANATITSMSPWRACCKTSEPTEQPCDNAFDGLPDFCFRILRARQAAPRSTGNIARQLTSRARSLGPNPESAAARPRVARPAATLALLSSRSALLTIGLRRQHARPLLFPLRAATSPRVPQRREAVALRRGCRAKWRRCTNVLTRKSRPTRPATGRGWSVSLARSGHPATRPPRLDE